jgi:hypothetical protein
MAGSRKKRKGEKEKEEKEREKDKGGLHLSPSILYRNRSFKQSSIALFHSLILPFSFTLAAHISACLIFHPHLAFPFSFHSINRTSTTPIRIHFRSTLHSPNLMAPASKRSSYAEGTVCLLFCIEIRSTEAASSTR